ncbi:MAG: hypothetical protein Q7J25_07055 [Vicinamibacterales bacterium]|nr:hypothetical protein [Vicinamibacterales bacterium]
MQDYEYDVAISFLSSDEGLARELRDVLSPSLRVFLYTHRQQEIAGTDGLVTFRSTFRDISRLVVVLYREGWGDTQWTRVEQEAITDRFLKEGHAFLLFVMIRSQESPPPWVPEKQIRFNLDEFGLEQVVGAIKLRVQELGGSTNRETLADRARRADERQQFQIQTQALKQDPRGVQEVHSEGCNLVTIIQALAEEAARAAPGLGLEFGVQESAVGIRSPRASVFVQLVVPYSNTLRGSFLSVRQMMGGIILPGENKRYLEEPRILNEQRYEPERSQALGWCWRDPDGKLSSSSALADRIVRRLIDRIEGEK